MRVPYRWVASLPVGYPFILSSENNRMWSPDIPLGEKGWLLCNFIAQWMLHDVPSSLAEEGDHVERVR